MIPLIEYKPTVKGCYRLLIYAKEERQWPFENRITMSQKYAIELYNHLSFTFGISVPTLEIRKSGGGVYRTKIKRIRVGGTTEKIRYSTLIHEYAHHLADTLAHGHRQKHNKKFWNALGKCYLESNMWFRNILK